MLALRSLARFPSDICYGWVFKAISDWCPLFLATGEFFLDMSFYKCQITIGFVCFMKLIVASFDCLISSRCKLFEATCCFAMRYQFPLSIWLLALIYMYEKNSCFSQEGSVQRGFASVWCSSAFWFTSWRWQDGNLRTDWVRKRYSKTNFVRPS